MYILENSHFRKAFWRVWRAIKIKKDTKVRDFFGYIFLFGFCKKYSKKDYKSYIFFLENFLLKS